jgi:hypothetical protein
MADLVRWLVEPGVPVILGTAVARRRPRSAPSLGRTWLSEGNPAQSRERDRMLTLPGAAIYIIVPACTR